MQLIDIDAAIMSHMAHGAMAGAEPLVDSLYGQLEGPAAQGAQPAHTAGAGLTQAQRAALAAVDESVVPLWLAALVAVAAFAASAVWPWGFA